MNTSILPSSFSLLIKENPDLSQRISKDISNLKTDLNEATDSVKDLLFKSIDIGDNQKAKYYSDLAVSISQFAIMLNTLLDTTKDSHPNNKNEKQLDLEDVGLLKTNKESDSKQDKDKAESYIKNISLWDVQTNYKPVSFTFKGKTVYVSKWRDLTKILLSELAKENEETFIEYVEKGTFNSLKTKCFAKSKLGMITPVPLKTKSKKIFVDIDKLLLNNKRIFKMVLEDIGLKKDDILLDIRLSSRKLTT